MAETYLILLAGGVMLAGGASDPKQVTLRWLRLGGIIALALLGLGGYFLARREGPGAAAMWAIWGAACAGVMGQLAFVQVAARGVQRFLALVATILAVALGAWLIRIDGSSPHGVPRSVAILSAAGVAAMTGLVLMDMLLGHAYLTASQMTMRPFTRLTRWLGGTLAFRAAVAVGATMAFNAGRPVEMLWGVYGLYVGTRWLVGLAVPAVFVYMVRDCIRRRATQSATGILYVAGVLVFIGEIVALWLVRQTGLPF